MLVEAVLEDLLDGAIGGRAEVQRPATRRIQSATAVLIGQSQESLDRTQMIQHAMREEAFDHSEAGGARQPGLGQAPLRIAHEIRLSVRRDVIFHRRLATVLEQAWMNRHQVVLLINAHGVRRDFQPQRLVNQAKRCRVVAVVMNDMTIRVQLGLGPGSARRCDGGERLYQSRHTAATLWLASGENPQWIARQLGHSSTEMLFKVYSRFVPNLTRQDGSAFERLLMRNGASPGTSGESATSSHAQLSEEYQNV